MAAEVGLEELVLGTVDSSEVEEAEFPEPVPEFSQSRAPYQSDQIGYMEALGEEPHAPVYETTKYGTSLP